MPADRFTRLLPGLGFLLAAPLLFSANMIAARWTQQADIPPLFLACARWVVAFALIGPFVARTLWRRRDAIARHAGAVLVLGGLGFGLAVAPQYMGAQWTGASNIALLFTTSPVLVAAFEALLRRRLPRRREALGVALALAGVLVILGKGDMAALAGLRFGRGDLLVLVAVCGWAGYTVLMRRLALPDGLGELARLAVLMLGGLVFLGPAAGAEAGLGRVPAADLVTAGAVLFLALVPSLGAYFAYGRAVALFGATAGSMSMYLVPLYTGLLAWPLLGETPRPFHLVGLALVLPGVALAALPASFRMPVALWGRRVAGGAALAAVGPTALAPR